uniref:FIP-RBD domain-containing protein n=1 Tax=Anolis carolinensis TaxID=28377 RepID=H9G6K3_ANOCA
MGSESTYSECETFTDEDTGTLVHHEMHDEIETDSAIDSAVHSEFTDPIEEPENGLSLTSDVNSHSIVTVITGEEHFEDYGEGNEVDLFSESLCNGESGFSRPHPARRASLYPNREGVLIKSAVEIQNIRKAEVCPCLKIHWKLKLTPNLFLFLVRANALEEQLKEQELKSDEVLMEEVRKQRELLCKMEREKSIEIENLQARLQQLDDENSELRSCVPCLKANIERLEEVRCLSLSEILIRERGIIAFIQLLPLIEDLRKQLEHLQLFKLEAEQRRGRSSSIGLQEYNSRTRETELEQEIRRLKQDNRTLKDQNDELNGQIINLSIQGAKNLFSASFSESLAAEISSVSRDELMEAIQKQEEINYRLQDYIDRIIVAIMETNPSILEVK